MQVYILIGCVLFAWFLSGLMADNYALRRHFKQQQKLSKIDLDRYNFVVGMLNQTTERFARILCINRCNKGGIINKIKFTIWKLKASYRIYKLQRRNNA